MHREAASGYKRLMPDIAPSAIEAVIPLVGGVVGIVFGYGKTRSAEPRAERAKKVLRWASPALIVFAVFLFARGYAASAPADAELAAVANGIKTKLRLPVQVDDDTRLDDVRAISPDELGYFLTLTRTTKSELAGNPIGARLESTLRGGACHDPNYAKLFAAGIRVRVTYQTRDAAEVARIVISPKDCGL